MQRIAVHKIRKYKILRETQRVINITLKPNIPCANDTKCAIEKYYSRIIHNPK